MHVNPRLAPPPPPRQPQVQGPYPEVVPFAAMMSPPPPPDISGASGTNFTARLPIFTIKTIYTFQPLLNSQICIQVRVASALGLYQASSGTIVASYKETLERNGLTLFAGNEAKW